VNLRDRLNKGVNEQKRRISYNAILIKIAARALRLHPAINASVHGDEIRIWQQIHIGVAMEADDALVVPVIRNPDMKSIAEINRDLAEIIARTREKRLAPDDLSNGTFTISNLGFADIDFFTPILRPPESALLGVGRITEKPVIKDGVVTAGRRIGLSLTIDHRIIDGAPGARFLKTIKELLEDPLLLVH
jgi:pyruvate/2-oxoglutarate dehydrogenase complex dihydrolipoamide acyltransferase (E2) component